MEQVTAPLIARLFEAMVGHLGASSPGADHIVLELSPQQRRAVSEIEDTLLGFTSPGGGASDLLASSLPKGMFWLGCSMTLNHVVATLLGAVLQAGPSATSSLSMPQLDPFPRLVSDAAFLAAVQFVHKRYLFGQAVLDTSVREGLGAKGHTVPGHGGDNITPMLCTVLRSTPGTLIDRPAVLRCINGLRRQIDGGTAQQVAQAEGAVQHLLQLLSRLGIGEAVHGDTGAILYIRKHGRQALSAPTLGWLRQHRVPRAMFGPNFGDRMFVPKDIFAPGGQKPPLPIEPAEDTTGGAAAGALPALRAPARAACPPPPCEQDSGDMDVEVTPSCQALAPPQAFAPAADGSACLSKAAAMAVASGQPRFAWSISVGHGHATKKDIRAAIRQRLVADNFRSVLDERGTSDAYWRYRARCTEHAGCPFQLLIVYHRRRQGHPPGTVIAYARGDHTGGSTGVGPSGRIFTPWQQELARDYFRQAPGRKSARQLRSYLAVHSETDTVLPTDRQLSDWLRCERGRRQRASAAVRAQPGSQHCAAVVERSIEQWARPPPPELHGLYILGPWELSDSVAFIGFTCRGMVQTLARCGGGAVHLVVDTKMGMLNGGWGVATVSILVKDQLRMTTLTRRGPHTDAADRPGPAPARRVQARAWTCHAMPIVQAVIHAETTANYIALFRALERMWSTARPGEGGACAPVRRARWNSMRWPD